MRNFNIFLRLLNHPLNKNNKLSAFLRIVWWKLNQVFFRLPAIVEIGKGIKCICYPDSSYGGLIVYTKFPEYPEMTLLNKYLKKSDVFIDVGANIGAYSLVAASKIIDGKIYAFEPIPKVSKLLNQNIKLNFLEHRIQAIEKVVSDKNGSEMFSIQDISEYSHISYKKTSKDISIPSVTLDSFCKKEQINFIDLVKIDVEGAEIKVLKGLKNSLKNMQVGLLIIELSGDSQSYGNLHKETTNFLNNLSYSTYRLDNNLNLQKIEMSGNLETFNIVAFLEKDKNKINKILRSKS